jgi:hypothetical protein
LIYSQSHLTYALTEYVRHYNTHRPHRLLDQQPPLHDPVAATPIGPRVLRPRTGPGRPGQRVHLPTSRLTQKIKESLGHSPNRGFRAPQAARLRAEEITIVCDRQDRRLSRDLA